MRRIAFVGVLAGCTTHGPTTVTPPVAAPAVRIDAVDADGGRLRDLLARDISYVSPAALVRVSGHFEGNDPHAARDALLAAYPALAVPTFPRGGEGEPLSLDFRDADLSEAFGVLASVLEHDLVVAPGVPRVDVHVRSQPASAVIAAATTALSLVVERADSVSYFHPRGTPGLGTFVERGDRVALAARDARAGELDALLAALGVGEGDAACDAGAAITVDLHRATAGATTAVIAALSGASGGHCALPIVRTAPADGALLATARAGGHEVALYRAGTAAVIVAPSSTWLTDPIAERPSLDEIVARGRPAAVVVIGDRTSALYELDGAWAFGDATPGLTPR